MLDMNIFFTIFVMLCTHTNLRLCTEITHLGSDRKIKFKMRNLLY